MIETILKILKRDDYATIGELLRWLNNDAETRGTNEVRLPGNLVVFAGLSEKLSAILKSLIEHKKIYLHEPTMLERAEYGPAPRLPEAMWTDMGCYTDPHWLPAVMSNHC